MAKTVELQRFYASKAWQELRISLILKTGGKCDHCGKIALDLSTLVAHHKQRLTPETLQDANISLHPGNIQILCRECHNRLHAAEDGNRFGKPDHKVWIICGAPLSGKTTYVRENAECGDLIVDLDDLWQAVSGLDRYEKPDRIKANVFALHNLLLDQIRTRTGAWMNAWVIGGYPYHAERERLAQRLGAECVLIQSTRAECLARAAERPPEWIDYVNVWFDRVEGLNRDITRVCHFIAKKA